MYLDTDTDTWMAKVARYRYRYFKILSDTDTDTFSRNLSNHSAKIETILFPKTVGNCIFELKLVSQRDKNLKLRAERICLQYVYLFSEKIGDFGPNKVSVSVSKKKVRY